MEASKQASGSEILTDLRNYLSTVLVTYLISQQFWSLHWNKSGPQDLTLLSGII
jgi:hypothetical protein